MLPAERLGQGTVRYQTCHYDTTQYTLMSTLIKKTKKKKQHIDST